METFSELLAICAGNSPINFPHKGQWRGTLMFSLICAWIYSWVNNGETGDLRRHRAHYDVIVMLLWVLHWFSASVPAMMYTETEMSSFWWNFHHWLHWKLSKWQLPVQPVIKISSKWRHFRFSVWIFCYIGPRYNSTALHIWTKNDKAHWLINMPPRCCLDLASWDVTYCRKLECFA